MEDSLNLGGLLPSISSISLPIDTAEQLSALFVVILLLSFTVFLYRSIGYFRDSSKGVAWLEKQLKPLEKDTVIDNQLAIRSRAESTEFCAQIGHLWLEFDETLIEVQKHNQFELQNTIDASHFFNTSTLAAKITENRMIAAVPGFLTALGVVGTFIGLQLGLAELNISSNASVEDMKLGVSHVINGAKVAFMTSVWGVALSVVFNFTEKCLEQKIRNRIKGLQNKIDSLFPRMSAEFQLQQISENSEQSRESLQGLAEKIGEKMQESMLNVSQNIQDSLETSLEKVMAPAINKFVDETSDGNQKALEGLLGQFMEGFGKQGAEQRMALDDTTDKVNQAIENMSQSMQALVNKIEAAQNEFGDREKQLVANISDQVIQLVEQGQEQRKILAGLMEEHVSSMSEQLTSREHAAQQREQHLASTIEEKINLLVESTTSQSEKFTEFASEQLLGLASSLEKREVTSLKQEKERNEVFLQQTDMMKKGTEALMHKVEQNINHQQSTVRQILEQGKQLQQSVETSVQSSASASQSMEKSAAELRNAADSMNVFGSHIREAGNNLAGSVSNAVNSIKDLAEQNQLSVERMESLRGQLVDDTARFEQLAEKINGMIVKVNSSFDSLSDSQEQFLERQKQNVAELAQHMTELLKDYASQANTQTKEHLVVWSQSTSQYAENMNKAVNALANVVDEIQNKVAV